MADSPAGAHVAAQALKPQLASADAISRPSALPIGLDFLGAWQARGKLLGQGIDDLRLPIGHADGRAVTAQRVFGHDAVLRFAQQEPNGGLVIRVGKEVIDGGHVHTELAQMSRLELARLQLDEHVGAELQVTEQQVGVELVVADDEAHLLPDECEPLAEFQQKLLDVVDELHFELTLIAPVRHGDDVEDVGVFGDRWGKVGVRRRERRG